MTVADAVDTEDLHLVADVTVTKMNPTFDQVIGHVQSVELTTSLVVQNASNAERKKGQVEDAIAIEIMEQIITEATNHPHMEGHHLTHVVVVTEILTPEDRHRIHTLVEGQTHTDRHRQDHTLLHRANIQRRHALISWDQEKLQDIRVIKK